MILHNRGGSRINAGRKSNWSTSETQTIRVPVNLVDPILEMAHKLDSGENIESDTKSNSLSLEYLQSIKEKLLTDKVLTRGGKDKSVVRRVIDAMIDCLTETNNIQDKQISLLDIDTKSNIQV
jgi:hypothetical protein